MYNIMVKKDISTYEIEELVKQFMPSSEFQIMKEKALDGDQGFLMIFDLRVEDYFLKKKPESKKEIKDCLKRNVYKTFSKETGYFPPWGILTGVRPLKIVSELKLQGIDHLQIKVFLKEYYLLREDKIHLLLETIGVQESLQLKEAKKSVGIYIGIPFCPSRCVYCSFPANIASKSQIDLYLTALYEEIRFVARRMKECGMYAESIYIGGGTPTVLDEQQLKDLLYLINETLRTDKCMEFTIEAGRPDTITKEKLSLMKECGLDRISINPQTMNDVSLEKIGRNHTKTEIKKAYKMAIEEGIHLINMDLIAGLPDEDIEDFTRSIREVIAMNPANITVHTLALKKSSKLRDMDELYNYKDNHYLEEMVECSARLLHQAGYEPYYLYRQKYMSGNLENVGYGKRNTQCIYNIRIMDEKQTIIALGAGGVSKAYYPKENRLERIPNVSNYEIYINRIQEMMQRKEEGIFREEPEC